MKKSIAAFTAALLLASCASTYGTSEVNDFTRFTRLEAGVTTKKDIYGSFGQPHFVLDDVAEGGKVWRYFQIRSKSNALSFVPVVSIVAGAEKADIVTVSFFFDANGAFTRVEREEEAMKKSHLSMLGDLSSVEDATSAIKAEMDALNLRYDRKAAKLNARRADVYAN